VGNNSLLVVGGSASLRQLLRDCLTSEGFAVEVIANAGEARQRCPDALLVVMGAPGGEGDDVLSRRRADGGSYPVLAVGGEADALRGLALGADGYAVVPFRTRELAARIRAVIRRAAHLTVA
jgi:DNA-binding response OmpR family regulator